jgi:hypothetical protein
MPKQNDKDSLKSAGTAKEKESLVKNSGTNTRPNVRPIGRSISPQPGPSTQEDAGAAKTGDAEKRGLSASEAINVKMLDSLNKLTDRVDALSNDRKPQYNKRKAHEISDSDSDEDSRSYRYFRHDEYDGESDEIENFFEARGPRYRARSDCDSVSEDLDELDNVFRNGHHNNASSDLNGKTEGGFAKALESLSKFFDQEENLGPAVHEHLAKLVNGNLRKKPKEEKVLKIAEAILKPENLPNLTVPKTNNLIWDRMRKGPRIVDAGIQKAQTLVANSLTLVVQTVNAMGSGATPGLDSHLEPLMNTIRLMIASFNYLTQVRKDTVRNELHDPVAKLCNWDTPVGQEVLFDVDIVKKVKEIEDDKALDKTFNVRKKKPTRVYGQYGHYHYAQKQGSSQWRGRGRGGYPGGKYSGKKPFLGQSSRRGKKRPSPKEQN